MKKRKGFIFLYVLMPALFMAMLLQKPIYAEQTGMLAQMSAKVYEAMSDDSSVVANIIYGNRFDILSEETASDGIEWYFIQTDIGIKGYIKKENVQQEKQEAMEIQKKQQIEFAQNVNIRKLPTTEAEIVGRVPQHTILEPVQTQENEQGEIWYQIEYEGIIGFVRENTVDIIEIEETVENVKNELQTNKEEFVEPQTQTGMEEETEEIKEKQESKPEKSDKQDNDKQEKIGTEPDRIITRKTVNPVDGVVVLLGLGSLISALLAWLVIKRMRKQQRKAADNHKNNRRKGRRIC